jgi:3-oxoacyl-[acyl-carrier protein] reductase
MGHLDGRAAIVTGAGRGIGRGEALALAVEGAAVVVNDVDRDVAQQVVDEIEAGGGRALANDDDVASWAGAEQLVAAAVGAFGKLDILVNNAGILRDKMSFNMDESDWDDVVRVHLKGHFAPSRFAALHWRTRSKAGEEGVTGRIVNTSSESGLFGNPGQANYAAAKAGIYGMTLVLGRELKGYGVTVNAIAPRARTRMTESLVGPLNPGDAPAQGFDAMAPENVGPVVAWLCSDDAADVSGQLFIVTGGRVHHVQGFTVVGEVRKEGRWSIDELVAAKAELFGGRRSKLPGFGLAL